ncbi:MAG: YegS/Rv2252/BmrU family lipid kinase [Acidimicrobiia bacterium]|nr:YegS/Rv2252/BmrU family lipid kinase [Acidimicrobiia bacterium]
MIRWFAVINPTAGRRGLPVAHLREIADRYELDVTFVASSSIADAVKAVTRAVADGFTHFVSVGGDGTAHVLINTLLPLQGSQRFALAVVASGSGSDLVRTFGHSRSIEEAFQRLIFPDRYPIDVGVIVLDEQRTYFLNAANVGVAAASAAVAVHLPRFLGGLRYIIAFWIALARYRSRAVTVTVDRHQFRGRAINVVVANGQFFGGGMNIAARASMADGLFDIQVFMGPKRQAFTVMPRVLRGTHLTHHSVQRYVGKEIAVSGKADVLVEADGELIGRGGPTINVLPRAIDLVI